MPNEMFTDLPQASNANLTDILCAVQGYSSPSILGYSRQVTAQQLFNLFQNTVIVSYGGNPNGFVAGTLNLLCWDSTNQILYVCTTAGVSASAVWTKSITLTAGSGITIVQNGNNISISASVSGFSFNVVTAASASMTSSNGYIVNYSGGVCSLLLPSTSSVGDVINIVGESTSGWTITQGNSQRIRIGSVTSTAGVGGSVSSSNGTDSLRLVCITANILWTTDGAPQSSGLVII